MFSWFDMMFKQAEKERVSENMLNEIHNGRTSVNLRRRLLMGDEISLQPGSSRSSSPFSGEFCSSDDGSPFLAPREEAKYQIPSTHYKNGFCLDRRSPDPRVGKKINEHRLDELGLSEHFYRMHINDGQNTCSKLRPFRVDSDDPDEFGFGHFSPSNVVNYDPFEGVNKSVFDYGRSQSSRYRASGPFDDEMSPARIELQPGYTMGNPLGSNLCEKQPNALYHDRIKYLIERRKEQGSSYNQRGIQLHNAANAIYWSQQNRVDYNTGMGTVNSKNLGIDYGTPVYHHSGLGERAGVMLENGVPLSFRPKKGARGFEAYSCEDSFIIQEKTEPLRDQRKTSWNKVALKPKERSSKGIFGNGQNPNGYFPVLLQANSISLAELQGSVYFLARDQQGCRFLQRIFEDGTCQDMEVVFDEIMGHMSELMMNPFGNYLVQKLLEVCNEEQRMRIVHTVTEEPGELVRICLNTHGTRSVQKLIETLKARQQISLVVSALEPGFLDLIKDLNGNHVVQRCLQCLSNEDNTFIFDAAAKFCVDIATHRHGCCVLQRCIAHSTEEHQENLIAQISANGLLLAQDAFGNYVVQYIIELKIPSAAAKLAEQFKRNYVQLSMQKFSSHVVEKCLKYIEESRPQIIHELLSNARFEQLLQDQFANYVIQSALEVTKGALRASLVEAVRPHTILRTSPYCKRIFSRNLLKK